MKYVEIKRDRFSHSVQKREITVDQCMKNQGHKKEDEESKVMIVRYPK